MRAAAWAIVLVGFVGCEEKLAKPVASKPDPALPAEAPENVADKELQRFLNGMLITTETKPPDEAVWPVDDNSMVYWVVQSGSMRFGYDTREKLMAALQKPVESSTRYDAWHHFFYWNHPQTLRIWKHLFEVDPEDMEAAFSFSYDVAMLDSSKAALELIAPLDPTKLKVKDRRGA